MVEIEIIFKISCHIENVNFSLRGAGFAEVGVIHRKSSTETIEQV